MPVSIKGQGAIRTRVKCLASFQFQKSVLQMTQARAKIVDDLKTKTKQKNNFPCGLGRNVICVNVAGKKPNQTTPSSVLEQAWSLPHWKHAHGMTSDWPEGSCNKLRQLSFFNTVITLCLHLRKLNERHIEPSWPSSWVPMSKSPLYKLNCKEHDVLLCLTLQCPFCALVAHVGTYHALSCNSFPICCPFQLLHQTRLKCNLPTMAATDPPKESWAFSALCLVMFCTYFQSTFGMIVIIL